MPRKGGGRKGFLKTAKPDPEDDNDATVPVSPAAGTQAPQAAEPNPDLASRFLKDEPTAANVKTSAAAPDASTGKFCDAAVAGAPAVDKAGLQSETKGQLVQRHKRVSLFGQKSNAGRMLQIEIHFAGAIGISDNRLLLPL